MGFNNGYDSGYADALEDVRNGRVAGLGPASGGGGAAPAFDAGVLEGYDVEKLLSEDDIETYLSSLTDAQLKGLVSSDDTPSELDITSWGNVYSWTPRLADTSRLGTIFTTILDTLHSRGLLYDNA